MMMLLIGFVVVLGLVLGAVGLFLDRRRVVAELPDEEPQPAELVRALGQASRPAPLAGSTGRGAEVDPVRREAQLATAMAELVRMSTGEVPVAVPADEAARAAGQPAEIRAEASGSIWSAGSGAAGAEVDPLGERVVDDAPAAPWASFGRRRTAWEQALGGLPSQPAELDPAPATITGPMPVVVVAGAVPAAEVAEVTEDAEVAEVAEVAAEPIMPAPVMQAPVMQAPVMQAPIMPVMPAPPAAPLMAEAQPAAPHPAPAEPAAAELVAEATGGLSTTDRELLAGLREAVGEVVLSARIRTGEIVVAVEADPLEVVRSRRENDAPAGLARARRRWAASDRDPLPSAPPAGWSSDQVAS